MVTRAVPVLTLTLTLTLMVRRAVPIIKCRLGVKYRDRFKLRFRISYRLTHLRFRVGVRVNIRSWLHLASGSWLHYICISYKIMVTLSVRLSARPT